MTKKTFISLSQASLSSGVSKSHISAVCNGKREYAGGFRWEFANIPTLKQQSFKFYRIVKADQAVIDFVNAFGRCNVNRLLPKVLYIPNLLMHRKLHNVFSVRLNMNMLANILGERKSNVKRIMDFWLNLGAVECIGEHNNLNGKHLSRLYKLNSEWCDDWAIEEFDIKINKMLQRMVNHINKSNEEQDVNIAPIAEAPTPLQAVTNDDRKQIFNDLDAYVDTNNIKTYQNLLESLAVTQSENRMMMIVNAEAYWLQTRGEEEINIKDKTDEEEEETATEEAEGMTQFEAFRIFDALTGRADQMNDPIRCEKDLKVALVFDSEFYPQKKELEPFINEYIINQLQVAA
ncbi:MAG: hypothetical protein ABW007_03075 [Chitinophagaceae bacterium]